MNWGKSVISKPFASIHEFTKWVVDMDLHLPSTMVDEAWTGSRINGSWTT